MNIDLIISTLEFGINNTNMLFTCNSEGILNTLTPIKVFMLIPTKKLQTTSGLPDISEFTAFHN
jgi:hypothetical protein